MEQSRVYLEIIDTAHTQHTKMVEACTIHGIHAASFKALFYDTLYKVLELFDFIDFIKESRPLPSGMQYSISDVISSDVVSNRICSINFRMGPIFFHY